MADVTAATDGGFVVPVLNRDGYLVTVTLVVGTATEAEAIDCVGEMLRGQQRAWAMDSALLDYAIDRITHAPITDGNTYAEGDAFKSARAEGTGTPDAAC